MANQTIRQPYNGILFNNKREHSIDICNDMDEPQMHFAM